MSPLSYSRTRLRDSSSIVMAGAGSFVRVMRCTADIKPVLLSCGRRCCVCASNFPSNLFLPSSLGRTCTYRRRWRREKGDSGRGRENGGVANKRIRSPGLLFESSSGGFRLICQFPHLRPHAFRNRLQGISRSTSVFSCFLFPGQIIPLVVVARPYWSDWKFEADAARRLHTEERHRWFCTIWRKRVKIARRRIDLLIDGDHLRGIKHLFRLQI